MDFQIVQSECLITRNLRKFSALSDMKTTIRSALAQDSIVMTPKSTKPSIAILMPMVWGIRNVVHSGVLERLATTGVQVHLLMRDFDPALLRVPAYADFSLASSCQSLLHPPVKHNIKGRSFLRDVVQSAFNRRNKIGSYALYRRWFERHHTPARRLRARAVEFLGTLAQPAPIFFRLYTFYDSLYSLEYDLVPARAQLGKLAPDLIWSTVNIESTFERAYMLAARELGIPVVNSILSFDNLTSKAAHLVYDHYLVWSQGMKEQLLQFYPQVPGSQVTVAGTPQFDFHCRPDFRWSRQETLERLGLPSGVGYFLYTTGHQSLVPAEPDLVARLARKMRENAGLKEQWLVVRTHPLDHWGRWSGIENSSERVVLSPAWDSAPDGDGWALPSIDDQARFVSSLAHATACLNIASTTTLDAAILDRPVIGIRFDRENDAPREIFYEEYDTDHYRPLVESGGLRLAHNWSELKDLMQQAINWPEQDAHARTHMVAQECGVVDGRACERVVDTILDYLAKLK